MYPDDYYPTNGFNLSGSNTTISHSGMDVYRCVYIYGLKCTCMYMDVYICSYICMEVYVYLCISNDFYHINGFNLSSSNTTISHSGIYIWMYLYMYIYVFMDIDVCLCVYMFIYMYGSICVFMYMQ
jgi:hypothetical protein